MILPDLTFTTYSEDNSFRCAKDPEPYIRRQKAIFCYKGSRWHVKITFDSTGPKESPQDGSKRLCDFLNTPIRKKFKRHQEFQSFIRLIKFELLAPLDDTVTEIVLGLDISDIFLRDLLPEKNVRSTQANRFLDIAHILTWTMREDPLLVFYPPYISDALWPKRWLSDVKIEEHITGSAF